MHTLLNTKTEDISLSDICTEPGPTTMSFGYDPALLEYSLSNTGMVNPPLVRVELDSKATIIAGFRRVRAARSLGWKSLSCKLVFRSEVGDLAGLMINLYDNLTVRTLNEIEKGMVLSRLGVHLGSEEILSRFMPLLGMASHYPLYRLYLDMENELSLEEKEFVAQGSISMIVLKTAMTVEPASRLILLRMLHNLRLNINQQIQFIEYMIDLSISNHKDISEIAQEPAFADIWGPPSPNRPQKARAILNYIKSRRFPILTRAEQGFRSSVARLKLPKGVRIEPPPYFEGPELKMEIRFRDGRDLKRKVDDLARLETLETIAPPGEAAHDD